MNDDEWEGLAAWWTEHYTGGADREYEEQLIPLLAAELGGCSTVVDIGCGDGQVARAIAAGGATVIGVDPTVGLLATAASRGGGVHYSFGTADALPLAASSCDGAVLCLVLEHLDDLAAAVAEVGRVVRPGGRCGVLLNHPVTQSPGSGLIEDHLVEPPERFWRIGAYLVSSSDDEQVARGVTIRFHHRPLSAYVNAFAAADLLVERMLEPAPLTDDAVAAAVPRSIYLRLRKS